MTRILIALGSVKAKHYERFIREDPSLHVIAIDSDSISDYQPEADEDELDDENCVDIMLGEVGVLDNEGVQGLIREYDLNRYDVAVVVALKSEWDEVESPFHAFGSVYADTWPSLDRVTLVNERGTVVDSV